MGSNKLEIRHGALVSVSFPKNKHGGRPSAKYGRFWIVPEIDQAVEPDFWYQVQIVNINPTKDYVLYCTIQRKLTEVAEIEEAKRLLKRESKGYLDAEKKRRKADKKRQRIVRLQIRQAGREGRGSQRYRDGGRSAF